MRSSARFWLKHCLSRSTPPPFLAATAAMASCVERVVWQMEPFALCAVTTPSCTSTGLLPEPRLVVPTRVTAPPLTECGECTKAW